MTTQLVWSSPHSAYVQPQPTIINMRRYAAVRQNVLYAQRILIPYNGRLVRLGMLLSTNQPPTTVQLALYRDENSFPGAIVVSPFSAAIASDMDESGRQEIVLDPSIPIEAGIVWLAFVSRESPVVFQSPGDVIPVAQASLRRNGDLLPEIFPRISHSPRTIDDSAIITYAVVEVETN